MITTLFLGSFSLLGALIVVVVVVAVVAVASFIPNRLLPIIKNSKQKAHPKQQKIVSGEYYQRLITHDSCSMLDH